MNRRLPAIGIVGVLPWTILLTGEGTYSLVFAWGLLSPDPIHTVTIISYVFEYTQGLPQRLLAWPIGVGCYSLALGSAISGTTTGREDPQLTAWLLLLAGMSQLVFSIGIARRDPSSLVLPTGTAMCWLIVWWFHRSDILGIATGRS